MKQWWIWVIIAVVGGAVLCLGLNDGLGLSGSETATASPSLMSSQTVTPTVSNQASVFVEPIANAKNRITKKTFGIYVTPKDSPVSPERFTGYHTGVDFETTPEETNKDVPVYVICDGPLLQARTASGYGGVAVQKCQLESEAITVIYGHIRLSSVTAKVGQQLTKGQQIAILGKGYSSETDGERKHLHLGIHKGSAVNIAGYVQTKAELANWIDFQKYLQ